MPLCVYRCLGGINKIKSHIKDCGFLFLKNQVTFLYLYYSFYFLHLISVLYLFLILELSIEHELGNSSVKGMLVNILGTVGQMVSVAPALCPYIVHA